MDFWTLLFVGVVIFFIGCSCGSIVQASIDEETVNRMIKLRVKTVGECIKLNKEICKLRTESINGAELLAWIENYIHNYEYVAPPTTGEITRKIREMMEG